MADRAHDLLEMDGWKDGLQIGYAKYIRARAISKYCAD